MKAFFTKFFLPMLIVLPLLAACGDDDDAEMDNAALVGTWKASIDGYVSVMSFNADGTGYTYTVSPGESVSNSAYDYFTDYKLHSNGKLMILWEDEDEYEYEGTIRNLTKDSFEARHEGGTPWITFNRVK